MGLPCNLHDEADLHAGILVGAAESVDHEEALAAELLLCKFLYGCPCLLGHFVVVVGIVFGSPPDFAGSAFLGGFVVNNVFVFRRTSGVDTGHYVDGTELSYLALVEAFKFRFGFFVVEDLVCRIVEDFLYTGDAVLGKSFFIHKYQKIRISLSRANIRNMLQIINQNPHY